MAHPLRIAITQRVVDHDAYPERRDALAHDWLVWVEDFSPGAALVPLPNAYRSALATVKAFDPDLLILSGGNDLGTAPDRDATERAVLTWFRGAGRPVLGVCRGLQFINDVFGGRVEELANRNHVGSNHPVEIVHPVAGLVEGTTFDVNSFHAKGVIISSLADELAAVAVSSDGYVEALIHQTEPILAFQWHPERPDPSPEMTSAMIRGFLVNTRSEVTIGR